MNSVPSLPEKLIKNFSDDETVFSRLSDAGHDKSWPVNSEPVSDTGGSLETLR